MFVIGNVFLQNEFLGNAPCLVVSADERRKNDFEKWCTKLYSRTTSNGFVLDYKIAIFFF